MQIKLKKSQKRALIEIAVSTVLLVAAFIADKLLFKAGEKTPFPGYLLRILLFIPSYLIAGHKTLKNAFSGIFNGQLFDENFLMSLSSLCALGLGECLEGCAVMILSKIGNLFESYAVSNARDSLKKLAELCPDSVKLCSDASGDEFTVIPAENAKPGDLFRVDAGEQIALDGTVIEGYSSVDCSSLTGEFIPVETGPGNEVMSGTVNTDGKLIIKATRTADASSAAKIVAMVEDAGSKKTATETFITKFALRYTPTVVVLAILVAFGIPLITRDFDFIKWGYRALTFLVISCPCALVISIPLVFFGTIGNGAKNGILFKDNSKIETIASVKHAAFDKTGTLTKGKPFVSSVETVNGIEKNTLLSLTGSVEYGSSHPIASAINNYLAENNIERFSANCVAELAGKGRSATVDGRIVCVGSRKYAVELTGSDPEIICSSAETAVYVVIDGRLAGMIVLSDEIKSESTTAVENLTNLGISTYILSGDNSESANRIGNQLGIDEVRANLLPEDKLSEIERIMEGGKCAYVGDGINDAPALARADVGYSMGSIGSDVSVDASDVVITGDAPDKVVSSIKMSKKAMLIAKENIIFALSIKALVMILGVLGFASIWLAVFADVGVSILCILNALRAGKN